MSTTRRADADRARQRADSDDLERLFREVAPGLWRTVYTFAAGRPAVAEDAVAEAFARALEQADRIRDPVPWLYRTALRIAAADLKRERTEPPPGLSPDRATTSSSGLGDLLPELRKLQHLEPPDGLWERAAILVKDGGDPARRRRPKGAGSRRMWSAIAAAV